MHAQLHSHAVAGLAERLVDGQLEQVVAAFQPAARQMAHDVAPERVHVELGVRVVAHKETPGLGDRIELAKSPWVHGFDGKSLGDPADAGWAVKKDGGTFDQFAGATVTPRAVVRAVHKALRYFDANRERLLAPEEATGHE